MAEDTVNACSKTPRQKFLGIECQVELNLRNHSDQQYILVLVASVILSATYSADNEASIDVLGFGRQKDVLHIQFQVDDKQTVEDVYNQVQAELVARDDDESLTAIDEKGEKSSGLNLFDNEKKESSSGLPNVLIAKNMDAAVYELSETDTYDLFITLDPSEGDPNKFHLRAYLKSHPDLSELDLILARCKDLIDQFHDVMHEEIQELDLLITSDKEKLSALNESMPPAENTFMHELAAQQALLTPNNEAVCAWDGSLTYEELDEKATSVAKYLVQRGVTVGSWVPLLLEKSKWHVVSMLAVRTYGLSISKGELINTRRL